jgi:aminopeptidase
MQEKMQEYAELVVKMGVNLQKGQTLVINSPIECAEFARLIAAAAYDCGAREAVVSWNDEQLGRLRFEKADDAVFDEFPKWRREMYESYAEGGAAFVSIAAANPELLRGIDAKKISRQQKAAGGALKNYRRRMMNNENTWCVVSIPTVEWAKKVYPDLEKAAAVEKLWQAIFQTVRIGGAESAVSAWEKHLKTLEENKNRLNKLRFKYLKYKNSLGTDLCVELPKGHIWFSGTEYTPQNVAFVANMPTEEVYTLPKRGGVNGTVVSAKPLVFQGNLIEDFKITFKDGKAVEFSAKKGEDVLKNLLRADEGAAYLGEVALVPYDSPISRQNILFYNTLFDENAACHLAFGKAYPTCIEGGASMDEAVLLENGVNDSIIHEDFMIGTKDLSIVGITEDGREITVFKEGNFAKME